MLPLLQRTINMRYFERVFVKLYIQHAQRMRHRVICGLPGSTKIFPQHLINATIFERERERGGAVTEPKMCVLIFSTAFIPKTSHCKNSVRYNQKIYWSSWKVHAILVRCSLTWIFLDFRGKKTRIKFHENPSSESRVVPRRRTDNDEANRRFSQFLELA